MKRRFTSHNARCDCRKGENQPVRANDGVIGRKCRGGPLRAAECAFWAGAATMDDDREWEMCKQTSIDVTSMVEPGCDLLFRSPA